MLLKLRGIGWKKETLEDENEVHQEEKGYEMLTLEYEVALGSRSIIEHMK